MPRPLLYEINTRSWLRELSETLSRRVELGSVPETEFDFWEQMGFTHLWLMGVWTTGPLTRQRYLRSPDTRERLRQVLPDWREEDVSGSPYAIAEYAVPPALGGEGGLQTFREKLRARGIRLLLDFIPNHVGLDHEWVTKHPEFFVQSPTAAPDSFLWQTASGARWLAHGKDPYFPAWNDTVQLDFRRADTRAAVLGELRSVAARCDGVRCDMAMLLLDDVFSRNWQALVSPETPADGEFWAEAMASVKRPGFTLIAEAYWDLEARLQSLGFDFTYDKRVTDFVVGRNPAGLQAHLLSKHDDFLRRSVHFLENHDEPRIAGRLSPIEQRAAAFLVLTLPGMCLLHQGQLTGARIHASVHLSRRPSEPADAELATFYSRLLSALRRTAIGRGTGEWLRPVPVSAEDETAQNIVAVCWSDGWPAFDLAAVNLSPNRSRCRVRWPDDRRKTRGYRVSDRLDDSNQVDLIEFDAGRQILLELPGFAAQLLHGEPAL
jgi:glycosidase